MGVNGKVCENNVGFAVYDAGDVGGEEGTGLGVVVVWELPDQCGDLPPMIGVVAISKLWWDLLDLRLNSSVGEHTSAPPVGPKKRETPWSLMESVPKASIISSRACGAGDGLGELSASSMS